jgi:GT2 family glycosyltransferase
MTTKPLVYIIILAWNRKDYTLACLDSLQEVTYPNFQAVVVDNGSQDDTVSVVRDRHPWVHVIENKMNLGFTGGNINGAQYAYEHGADYIMLLNNDVVVAADFLDRLIEVAESDERIGAVGPLIYFFDPPDMVWSAGGNMRLLGLHNEMLFIYKKNGGIPELVKSDMITGAALCTKRKIINRVGFLDNVYFCYNEDLDFCYRIRKAGYQILTVKQAKIWHKVSASTGGFINPVNQYLMARGRSIFIRKYGRWWEKLLFVPLAMAEATYVTVREFFKGNIYAALPKYLGYWDGLRRIPVTQESLGRIKQKFEKGA